MEDAVIARAPDLTGAVLGGRYEVLGKLGVGGMASVYEGRRVGLHNRVAIKVLRADLCDDPSNVKRFIREARASSVIEHENIVDIVDFGPIDSLPVYFVMEFLEGVDLRGEIKSKGAMDWNRTRRILAQVVSALGAAHDKAIVHRDVKPANIFLLRRQSGEEVAKVLDFGIAKVIEDTMGGLTRGHTVTNGLLGTVAYMAPEQARGGTIDARTDIYAVGCVAYQMLTGQAPFRGNNPYVVLEQHVSEPPRPPRELVSAIPPGAEAIVLRCLEKAPERRFQSMAELAEALAHGTTLEYGKGTNSPQAPGWNPPHPQAVQEDAFAAQQQHATEALGSGSGRRVGGMVSASYPAIGSTAKIDPTPSGHTQAIAPHTLVTAATEEAPPHSRIRLPALLGLGVALGLMLSLGLVFFVFESPVEQRSEAPVETAPQSTAASPAAEAPTNEVVAPPAPEPAQPTETPQPPPEPEVVAAEPKSADPEKPAEEKPKSRRPRRPRRPKSERPAATKPEPEPKPVAKPEPKPEPDEPLHPDLRNPYG